MNRSRVGALLLALLTGCTFGCARQSYSPRIDYVGEYRPAKKDNRRAQRVPRSVAQKVRVIVGQLPEGVRIEEGRAFVSPESPWELVAEAHADSNGFRGYFTIGFYDYNTALQKVACYPQVPLHWLTLGLWAAVPTDYVCNVREGRSSSAIAARRDRVVRTLRQAAVVTGSELIVLSEPVSGQVLGKRKKHSSMMKWDGGSGFLFRRK